MQSHQFNDSQGIDRSSNPPTARQQEVCVAGTDMTTSTTAGEVFAGPMHVPVNPAGHGDCHEGPRGFAHSLKDGETFVVVDEQCDINRGGAGYQGLYFGDTRHVSRLILSIEDAPPLFLYAATRRDNSAYVSHLLSPGFDRNGESVGSGIVHLERTVTVSDQCYYEQLQLTSYAPEQIALRVTYDIDVDFRDMFEIRGIPRVANGLSSCLTAAGSVAWEYRGLDGIRRRTHARFDPEPRSIDNGLAAFALELAPRQAVALNLAIDGGESTRGVLAASNCVAAVGEVATERRRSAAARCEIRTSNELYNRWIERSAADLDMLCTRVAAGRYPLAGLPWFNAMFGRDGIVTALQMLLFDASLARGVLTTLAQHQATEIDEAAAAEPGKILQEIHGGEMARLGEVPFGRYYGASDATPLYAVLAGRYLETTGDLDLIRRLWPHIDAALRWIGDFGDCDGDGFVESRLGNGAAHQGWRNSPGAVFHADGSAVEGPVALCEVQAYAHSAFRHGAAIARALGDMKRATELDDAAARLQKRFHATFWSTELGTYALALDSRKDACVVAGSSAGHALSGIAPKAYARRVANELLSTSMFNGWGIRTLSADARCYNPASYHNGSVWPHDNALISDGFRVCRMNRNAALLLRGFAEASSRLQLHRLPELLCGFPRDPELGPIPHPSACAPQAWAAGAVFMLLASSIGLRVESLERRVVVENPVLPDDLDEVEIFDLVVGDGSVDLVVYRRSGKVAVAVGRSECGTNVQILP